MATEHAHSGQTGLRLGGARADFVAGLGRKVSDLRTTSSKVREAPADIVRREELRRKMNALSSAAKLMKFDAMERALSEALGTIDRTDLDVPMEMVDVDAIDQVIDDLPALAWGDGDARISRVEPVAKPVVPTYSALVVGSPHIAKALLDTPAESADGTTASLQFTCESTPDAQAAFDLARTTEPDLVVLDADLEYAVELVEALMDDPITEAAPLVVVGSFQEPGEESRYVAMGVVKTLTKPTSKATLRTACEKALESRAASFPRIAVVGAPSSPPPSDQPHGDRARVRLRGPAAEVRLQGRRVVIADDDPAVVWFLADLLKTSGCIVHEAFDGKQALELAYRTSPDLLICDIMMPEIDGFALCRMLQRDVALHDVPVILLSWKEDLLQRVRELGAGAAGYVRKESDTRAIVARIREALRPRSRIETRLRDDGEVRGRMDGISVRTLLEIVCATRPEARVSVRDASFNYEIEIRDGAPQRATRTAGDGTFLEGSRVIAAMLGVGAGRFTVTTSTSKLDTQLDGNLAAQLAKPIARARAATALLTGAGTMKASQVLLDEDMLDDYLKAMPEQARKVAMRIGNGTSPRALVLEGACAASLVEDIVNDLASRGIVKGIEDDMGEDLLGPEVARLSAHTDTRASFAPHTATPEPMATGALAIAKNECANDTGNALCESPEPAVVKGEARGADGSFEDAVMNELALRSPEPAQLGLPLDVASPVVAVKAAYEDEGTPTHDQILALTEATVVENTTYEERAASETETETDGERADVSIPIDDFSKPLSESRSMKTPLTAVTTRDDEAAGLPSKSKHRAWPMVAFVAASGLVAWAVLHFSAAQAPKAVEVVPPPPPAQTAAAANGDEVNYTAQANDLTAGHGLLEISAPGDAVILVDGTERGRGGATLPLWAGVHDVRISGAQGEPHRAVEVRAAQIAHIKF
jgi:DNA-binding response OmpR family regulator